VGWTPGGVKLINISGEAVEDAPSDAVYGRSDGDWVQVAPFIISPTAPADPAPNQLWWDSSSGPGGGRLFVWFDDGTSTQWVVASPSLRGEVGPRGPQGQQGEKGDTGAAGEVEEAPIDGQLYLRKDGRWEGYVEPEQEVTELVFKARYTSDQSIPASYWSVLYYHTVDVDTQGGWNPATQIYQPTKPGFYHFQWITPTSVTYSIIQKNMQSVGDHSRQIMTSVGSGWFSSGSVIEYMNGTTDNVQVQMWSATGGTATGAGYNCFFLAHRLPSPKMP
jgi:hypothetical protein